MRHLLLVVSFVLFTSLYAHAQLSSVTLKLHPMPEQRSFDGRVEAINQATVSAETRGRIAEIMVDIGDSVAAGIIILTVTSTEQRAGVTQAEANVAEASSNLKAERLEHKRIEDLLAGKFVAKADMDRANARLSAVTAKVDSAKAALNSAREKLSYTAVRAPFSGIVSARYVEPGELVQPGTTLMSGYDPESLRIEVDIPQNVAEKVRELRLARVESSTAKELGESILPTKLILYPTADLATSTVRVRIELSQNQHQFRPGEFVKVLFTVGKTERLLIPLSSVVHRSEVTGVYVLEGGIPALRQIRAGEIFLDQLEVLAGLNAGEVVAIDRIAAAMELTSIRAKVSEVKVDD